MCPDTFQTVLLNHTPFPSCKMSDLLRELTAPNGQKYMQPLGLFINNEFVKSSDGAKLDAYNPTLVTVLTRSQFPGTGDLSPKCSLRP